MPPADNATRAGLASILEGFRYAIGRPELIGTYLVDMVALTFAMPMAVFPALAAQWGGAGGIVCVAGVIACVPLLPGFWRYRQSPPSVAERAA
jgi:hypothetical protein